MSRIRTIERSPQNGKNYFIVDACFLVNKYIPLNRAPAGDEQARINQCQRWWKEIDSQLKKSKARVYVPDVCIAEAFKALAKKFYQEKWFTSAVEYNNARGKLRKDIRTNARILYSQQRSIRYHDISTSRDIIIAVDRFYELFMKHNIKVSLPDLIILATAKYLMDFFDIPKSRLHIVTLDRKLRAGTKRINELPIAYDPTTKEDELSRVFR